MPYVIPDKQADAWKPIIGTAGAKRRLSAKRRNRGAMIYPGLMSDDPDVLRVLDTMAKDLSTIPVEIDTSGVLGPDAVPGDFYQLLTVSGYGMNPISVPPVSNAAIRSSLKLQEQFVTTRDKEIFDELAKLMFARTAPAPVSIRREASTGAPDYVNDVPKKKRELRHALQNLPRFLDLVHAGKLVELFVEFNSPIVHTTGERTQADKVVVSDNGLRSKDREVNDEKAARTGLAEGTRFIADKRVFKDGREVPGHFAGRRRTVFGTSFVPNYVCATFCSAMRRVYLDDFAFTWKHRTPDEILEKMRRYKAIVGFDVKQFDQTVASWMIKAMIDRIADFHDPRFCSLLRLLFTAPYIVPYPWIDGTSEEEFNPLFGDDPFSLDSFRMDVGLPSGIAINPDTGKFMMTWQYLVLLDRYFGNVMEVGVDTILRGQHPEYALLNMGDDCVLLVNDDTFQTWFSAGGGSVPWNYFYLEEERPVSFLGNVPYRDDKGVLQLAPNVVSYAVNWLVPEFGIDHASRRNFWAVGERERRVHYARAPQYPRVKEALEKTFYDVLGVYPSSLAEEAYQQQRRYMNLSTWDALVLQNPDYLHYKVDEKTISDEVLDLIVTSLPADETWPAIMPFFDKRFRQEM